MYLVRYSEIALKSRPVRRDWENRLVRNIKRSLGTQNVRNERGRIWVDGGDSEKLKKILGVQSFSPCSQCDLEDLEEFVLDYAKKTLEGESSFGLKVKRTGDHDFTSQDIARDLGAKILEEMSNLSVNLNNPQKWIFIEIRQNNCYIFDEIYRGHGGLPVGVSGRLVSIFSGDIYSAVSSWMMMKRGCEIVPIYFDCKNQADFERAKELENVLKNFYLDFNLIIVRNPKNKKNMLDIAEKIALDEGAIGFVTGETLGCKNAQIFENLAELDQLANLPIYRPLICFNEGEVEAISKEIGIKI